MCLLFKLLSLGLSVLMKTDLRVIYESLFSDSEKHKGFLQFISPALGSTYHLSEAQQIFVGWMDGSLSILPVVLSNICLLLKYLTNHGICILDKRLGGGKVFGQEVQKVIKQKSSHDWS